MPNPEPTADVSPVTPQGNVADLVAAASRRGADHPALVEPGLGRTLSWAEVDAGANAEAARLRAAGVQPGDRVLIRLGHGAPYCLALFGALRVGAIAVPVGPEASARELDVIAGDCTPGVMVAEPGDEIVDVLASANSARRLDPPETEVGAVAGATPVGGGEDIAVLGYTSGVTGVPRGVRISHRALLANRAQVAALRPVPVSPADRVLLQWPMSHAYGLGAGLLQVCWAGATTVLTDRFDVREVVEGIRRERVTVLAGVPALYRAMVELPQAGLRESLVTLRLAMAGGAPLASELAAEFSQACGLQLFEGYGLTETGPVLTSTLVGGLAKAGSVGRPLPGALVGDIEVAGVELRLVDSHGADIHAAADDEDEDDEPDTGLVAVRGPNLFSGYWPDGAGGPDEDGWFRTNDVGYVDADGDLHLVNRASDLVIVNGFNVYPREVELVLDELAGVTEAAVVGVPDPNSGQAVKALLVLAPGAELDPDAVREHCLARLARFKVPAVVEFVDSLPRSATGKINRAVLRVAAS
ncbi:long-chain fatty acid--CoA ligase [Pseudonocardia eucalypti]|uniref:Long-chain fatty acid--CoA ligase n=1 Tax=Pseudonocardia eucalypti TaxID=648755 RepID=A0ABP9Q1G0_9PSEU